MQRHHVGSGRRQVIPADWSAHHRPLLAGTRDATVTLRRPGGTLGAFNPTTGKYPSTANAVYYTGPARVQLMSSQEQDQRSGEQDVSTLAYAVTLDAAVSGVQIEDVCTVTAVTGNGDTALVGRSLIVDSVERGSLHWERRLTCTDNLEAQGVA